MGGLPEFEVNMVVWQKTVYSDPRLPGMKPYLYLYTQTPSYLLDHHYATSIVRQMMFS
jgi:hypothetical protein